MKDFSALVDALVQAGKAVLPLVIPGSVDAIAAGERMIEAIDHARDLLSDDVDAGELSQTRDELEAAVNAHVDETVARLRDEG